MPVTQVYQSCVNPKRVFYGRKAYLEYLRARRVFRLAQARRAKHDARVKARLAEIKTCLDFEQILDHLNAMKRDLAAFAGMIEITEISGKLSNGLCGYLTFKYREQTQHYFRDMSHLDIRSCYKQQGIFAITDALKENGFEGGGSGNGAWYKMNFELCEETFASLSMVETIRQYA